MIKKQFKSLFIRFELFFYQKSVDNFNNFMYSIFCR